MTAPPDPVSPPNRGRTAETEATSASKRRDVLAIYGCFFLSGFAGLIYETVWTQQFSVVFGTTELATATVLAAYMAGLAAGASVAARTLRHASHPLRLYALLELGIAGCALAVPQAIGLAGNLHAALLGGDQLPSAEGAAGALALYVTTSFAILILPTAMMGATLPILVRYAVRREVQVGRRAGALYTVNTAGAAAGTLAAAFLLLPWVGLGRTLWIAAGVNVLVFLLAAFLARRSEGEEHRPELDATPATDRSDTEGRWILPLILVSGAVALALEVFWTRLLTLVLGGSMYAFATMLASFLVGIALGAAMASRFTRSVRGAWVGFGIAQFAAAVATLAAYMMVDRLPELLRALDLSSPDSASSGSAASPDGFVGHLVDLLFGLFAGLPAGPASVGLCALILLPGAMAFGAAFPFAVRVLARGADQAGPASGRVYAWNTVGAILGSLGAGFWILPNLGFAGTVAASVGVCLMLGLLAALRSASGGRPARPQAKSAAARTVAATAATAATALIVWVALTAPLNRTHRLGDPHNLLRSNALGPKTPGPERLDDESPRQSEPNTLVYQGVGRSATVLLFERRTQWRMVSNGLPEAVIRPAWARPAQITARWLSLLPVAARPDTRSMLVIGLGGGVTLEDVPTSVEEIRVVELEPEVLEANRRLAGLRRKDPLADPRVTLHLTDARGALARTRRSFDAIVSQPSHPWTAGASQLFTREFFALVRERLSPSGVFVQWMGTAFVDRDLLASLVATLHDVFPHVEIYRAEVGSVLMLASPAPLDLDRTASRALELDPAAWSKVGVTLPDDVIAARWARSEGLSAIASESSTSGPVPVSTDAFNVLRIRAPKVVYGDGERSRLAALMSLFQPVDALRGALRAAESPAPQGPELRPRLLLYRRLLATGDLARGRYLLDALEPGHERQTALGLWQLARGDRRRAVAAFLRSLARNRSEPEARAGLLRALRPEIEAGHVLPALSALGAGWSPTESLLRDGWREARSARWQALQEVDGQLSRIDPRHPLYDEALRLRVRWRIHLGLGDEALEMLEPLFGPSPDADDLLLRAEAGIAQGVPRVALAAIEDALPRLSSPSLRARARALLLAVDGGPAASSALEDSNPQAGIDSWRRDLFTRLQAGRR